MMMICKKILIFFIISVVSCTLFSAQKYTDKQLDSLIFEISGLIAVDGNKALEKSKYLWKVSDINHRDLGKIQSLRFTSTIYMRMGRMEEAIQSINELEKLALQIKHYISLADALRLKSLAYSKLGLYDEALHNIDLALKYSEKIDSKSHLYNTRGSIYQAKSTIYMDKEKIDSVKYSLGLRENIKASEEYLKSYNVDKNNPDNLIIAYADIAKNYINLKKPDSAKIYLDTALKIKVPKNFEYSKGQTYIAQGMLYQVQNKHKEAIDILIKAYQFNKKYSNDPYNNRDIFKLLSVSYKELGDQQYIDYSEKHMHLADSLSQTEKRSLKTPINNMLNQKEQDTNKNMQKFIILFSVLLIPIIFFIYKKYKKDKKQTKALLDEKNFKIVEMEQKVNETFNKILQLAQNNDPSFLTRFKEAYPDFYTKLSKTYPDLTLGNIKFCAFLKLNLSTKEIAEYTNISVRSVEIKKGRLRKELSIPSSENLNKWMMEF